MDVQTEIRVRVMGVSGIIALLMTVQGLRHLNSDGESTRPSLDLL